MVITEEKINKCLNKSFACLTYFYDTILSQSAVSLYELLKQVITRPTHARAWVNDKILYLIMKYLFLMAHVVRHYLRTEKHFSEINSCFRRQLHEILNRWSWGSSKVFNFQSKCRVLMKFPLIFHLYTNTYIKK